MTEMKNELYGTNKNVRAVKVTSTNAINKADLEKGCPIAFTISVIGGRWRLSILALLRDHGSLRYSSIRSKLPNITERVLTLQLKSLEHFGLINKRIYAEVPARVEYALSEKGNTLGAILDEMTKWGEHQYDARHEVS